jgi:hypothetical protein
VAANNLAIYNGETYKIIAIFIKNIMSIETLRAKIHTIVNEIEDETALNILMEDAAVYLTSKNTAANDTLNAEQWATMKKAQKQIQNGQYKTYDEVKQYFSQWLTK